MRIYKTLMTVEELSARLEDNPEYQRRRKEKDENILFIEQQCSKLANPVLEKLRKLGFEASSMEELVQKYAPLSCEGVCIILEQVEPGQEELLCESLVRALAAANKRFDGSPLIRYYECTPNESLRWTICNTNALIHSHSIDSCIGQAAPESPLVKTLRGLGYCSQE